MYDEVLTLTLASGKPFVVRKFSIIAAHAPVKNECDASAKSKVYLSSGVTIFLRETPEFVVQP